MTLNMPMCCNSTSYLVQYLVQEMDYKITEVKTKFDMKLDDICHFELFGCVLTLS